MEATKKSIIHSNNCDRWRDGPRGWLACGVFNAAVFLIARAQKIDVLLWREHLLAFFGFTLSRQEIAGS